MSIIGVFFGKLAHYLAAIIHIICFTNLLEFEKMVTGLSFSQDVYRSTQASA